MQAGSFDRVKQREKSRKPRIHFQKPGFRLPVGTPVGFWVLTGLFGQGDALTKGLVDRVNIDLLFLGSRMHEQQVGGLRACAGDPRCRGPAFITRSYFSATNYPRSKVQTLDCVSHGPDKMRRVVIGHISNWEMVNCVEYVCTYIWIWASCQLCGEPAQKGMRTIEWKRLFASLPLTCPV